MIGAAAGLRGPLRVPALASANKVDGTIDAGTLQAAE